MADKPYSNVSSRIRDLTGRNLHHQVDHPLETVKRLVHKSFGNEFKLFDTLDPVVSVRRCFDELLVPSDHVSRSFSDTFYIDRERVLRTHTSAHQCELMKAGNDAFLVAGDCYRRDEIDAQHYPCFHQMEGVKLFDKEAADEAFVMKHLKTSLEDVVTHVFGRELSDIRWVDAYFPFTQPSLELEVLYKGDWMEVVGCGQVHPNVLKNCNLAHKSGWALGIGLERLAMALYDIPDIRLFWSKDERFLKQFKSDRISKFVPFSKYPECYKDVSFWLSDTFVANDLHALVGEVAGDVVESVRLIDEFVHPQSKRRSACYRICYRAMDRSLRNKEVNTWNANLRERLRSDLGLELRGHF